MRIIYPIVHALFYAFSLLPFRVLYAISDVFFVLVYYIVGYRKRVVRRNLESSFPEKDTNELRSIERGFYHFFCDYLVETIKLLSISREKMLKHFEIRGAEEVEKCFDEGQACAGILGHYCNWEYLSATGLAFHRYPEAVMGLIYHPLYNKVFDRLFIDLRQHLGGTCIPKKDVLRYLITFKREKKMSFVGYISDQAPKWNNIHLWIPFLGHDTPVFTNGETLMRKMNNAVFYADIQRPRRGYYIVEWQLITRTPNDLEENAIIKEFFRRLEESIRREPRYYLWSHNRWKRTHEEFDRRFVVKGKKVIPREQAEAQQKSADSNAPQS